MSLIETISSDIKKAMLAKDEASLRALRAIKSALLLIKTESANKEITEEQEIKLLQKLVKQRKESVSIYEQQNRNDLANIEKEELQVIEKYLPAQISDEELVNILEVIAKDLNASSISDLGKVMSVAMKKLGGKADGKAISEASKRFPSDPGIICPGPEMESGARGTLNSSRGGSSMAGSRATRPGTTSPWSPTCTRR